MGRNAAEFSRWGPESFDERRGYEEGDTSSYGRSAPRWSHDKGLGSGVSSLEVVFDEEKGERREEKRGSRRNVWVAVATGIPILGVILVTVVIVLR